jgi:hypothetical protein
MENIFHIPRGSGSAAFHHHRDNLPSMDGRGEKNTTPFFNIHRFQLRNTLLANHNLSAQAQLDTAVLQVQHVSVTKLGMEDRFDWTTITKHSYRDRVIIWRVVIENPLFAAHDRRMMCSGSLLSDLARPQQHWQEAWSALQLRPRFPAYIDTLQRLQPILVRQWRIDIQQSWLTGLTRPVGTCCEKKKKKKKKVHNPFCVYQPFALVVMSERLARRLGFLESRRSTTTRRE